MPSSLFFEYQDIHERHVTELLRKVKSFGLDLFHDDLITELAESSRQHLATFRLFSGTHFVALLDKAHFFLYRGHAWDMKCR